MSAPVPLRLKVSELGKFPEGTFYCLLDGKYVADYWELAPHCVVEVKLRLRGGKGGFGSLLRSFGSQFYKSTNQDACRDLSGRRVRDATEEQKLKAWISNAASRERERQQKRQAKLEKLASTPKHNFEDQKYFEDKQKILEAADEAVAQAIQESKQPEPMQCTTSGGISGALPVANNGGGATKRKTPEGKGRGKEPLAKASKYNWMGVDEADISDSSSDDDDDEHIVGKPAGAFLTRPTSMTSSDGASCSTMVPV